MPLDKYFKPRSVTWWAALALLAHGILTKDLQQIFEGLGGIGLRGAIR
jgi:hypothetical protein